MAAIGASPDGTRSVTVKHPGPRRDTVTLIETRTIADSLAFAAGLTVRLIVTPSLLGRSLEVALVTALVVTVRAPAIRSNDSVRC